MKTLREEIEAYIEQLEKAISQYIKDANDNNENKEMWNFYNGKVQATYASMYDLINILDKIDENSTK